MFFQPSPIDGFYYKVKTSRDGGVGTLPESLSGVRRFESLYPGKTIFVDMGDMIKKIWAFATKDGRLSKLAEGVVFGFLFGFAGGVAAGLAREYESWRHVGKPPLTSLIISTSMAIIARC